jgi:hypothetical protein
VHDVYFVGINQATTSFSRHIKALLTGFGTNKYRYNTGKQSTAVSIRYRSQTSLQDDPKSVCQAVLKSTGKWRRLRCLGESFNLTTEKPIMHI